ncbi:MAG: ZIP family metal transporter [Burkholderiales bacterium]|nr:ZIP family metal transporter [Burkholderiales bacterium]
MPILGWILLTCVAGGVLSVVMAAAFALRLKPARVPMLISFAVGALLGAVFLEILPHAFSAADDIRAMAATVLGGILLFFMLEKLVLWRHCHEEQCEAHDPHRPPSDHGRSGTMIMIGDTVHNFVDGVLIAAAFLADVQLGIVTALAIIAHEIPQEVGDFLILLNSGFSKRKAFAVNLLTSLAMVIGGLLGYAALSELAQWIPALLGLAAASMLYVSVADLIPGLHKRPELHHSLSQLALIGFGIGTIWATHLLFDLTH